MHSPAFRRKRFIKKQQTKFPESPSYSCDEISLRSPSHHERVIEAHMIDSDKDLSETLVLRYADVCDRLVSLLFASGRQSLDERLHIARLV